MHSSPSFEVASPPDPFELAADILDPPKNGDRELALQCASDLRVFIREAWPLVEPAEFISAWHIDVIAEHLQAQTDGDLPRLIINIPPRSTKSLTGSVLWPAWEWLRKPETRWLFASYAQRLAERDAVKMRRLLKTAGGRRDGTLFQRIGYQGVLKLVSEEPWSFEADQDAKTFYGNTSAGVRLTTSVGGGVTGEGGDRIVIDDPLNARQARSDIERTDANLWWDETMTTRFNNADATATLIMQRLHQDDLTGHLLEQGGWHHLALPAEYEPKAKANFTYPNKVTLPSGRELPGDPRTKTGELLDPVRHGHDKLAELRRGLGSYGYAGQMQQRPSPEEGGMFKRGWWRYWNRAAGPDDPDNGLPLDWMFDRTIASWDMRFTDSEATTTSFVVGQVWASYGADRYLLAQVRARLSFTESLRAVEALKAFIPTASAVLVEKKANGPAVMNTLRKKVPGLIPIEPEGGKDVRAAAVSPFVEAGNTRLPHTDFIPCPPGYEPTSVADFIEEHATFPNGTNDDQVDAHSQAINWLEGRGWSDRGAVATPERQDPRARRREPTKLSDDDLMTKPM